MEKQITIIGYGTQGKAQAICFRDAGWKIILGLRKDGKSWREAINDGFEVIPVEKVAGLSPFVSILIPDLEIEQVYKRYVYQNMLKGGCLFFAHGLNLYAKWITVQKLIDVIVVSPNAIGDAILKAHKEGKTIPGSYAIFQEATRVAEDRAKAYAEAIHINPLIKTTIEEEVVTDLFAEQVVLCGGLHHLISSAFDTLVSKGYSPKMSYLACMYELKFMVDILDKYGIEGVRDKISDTALYGDLIQGGRIINSQSLDEMKQILKEIRRGQFLNQLKSLKKEDIEKLRKNKVNRELEEVRKEIKHQLREEVIVSGEENIIELKKPDEESPFEDLKFEIE